MRQQLSTITAEGMCQGGRHLQLKNNASNSPAYSRALYCLLLAGPLGRYALQGLLPAAMKASLFEYAKPLQELTTKECGAVIHKPQTEVAVTLTQLERDSLAWELCVTRHWSSIPQSR